jgi:hypothetical protein
MRGDVGCAEQLLARCASPQHCFNLVDRRAKDMSDSEN